MRYITALQQKVIYYCNHITFVMRYSQHYRCGISRCWLDSMIIAQVSLRLATIKGHSKMCRFITQHNPTDVASFEGACNWHADCRNVHQSFCPWIECSFFYHKPSPKAFQRIKQYIQPALQPQTTCNHTSPGPPHPASSPPRSSETSHPDSCCNNRFALPKNFCTICQKRSQWSSYACSSSSSGSRHIRVLLYFHSSKIEKAVLLLLLE